MFKFVNYAFKELPNVQNGDEFLNCNLTRLNPHTKVFEGITGLKFTGCNLTNCDLPNDATKENCSNWHQEFCTNVHPHLVEKGIIIPCTQTCSHVVSTDTIMVDGVVVDVNYTYSDKGVS